MEKPSNIEIQKNYPWDNRHQTITNHNVPVHCEVWNPDHIDDDFEMLKSTVSSIQWIIGEAANTDSEVRAYGGKWSLSEIALSDSYMVNTRPMSKIFQINPDHILDNYKDKKKLFFIQAGRGLQKTNTFLSEKGFSLKATGASNGQTFGGAVSTGTHGSAFKDGSIQDCIVGIHVVLSKDKHLILERASYPVLKDSFAQLLGTHIEKDDDLFNATLVSFGSIGIIHGFIIETDEKYLLEMYPYVQKDILNLTQVMNTLNFDGYQLKKPELKDQLYHFEMTIDPYNVNDGVYIREMYKIPYQAGYSTPEMTNGLGPGENFLSVMGLLTETFTNLNPTLVAGLLKGNFPKNPQTGLIGEIFSATTVYGKAASMEIGIEIKNAAATLSLMVELVKAHEALCVLAFRFVKGSRALLAFTQWDLTCTIEIEAVYSSRTLNFYKALWGELTNRGIPYTFHWGQMNDLDNIKVRQMYGSKVDTWLKARNELLGEKERKIFSNASLRKYGLDK